MLLKTPNKAKELILYVDDEKSNLDSFKVIFRKDYEVCLATSAAEGLEIMEERDVRLVITDQRMPKMTGVEFLEKIANLYPDVTRIILTGYSDEEAIISAINKGRVFRYITKPWQKEELKKTIDYALEAYQLKIENKELVEKLKKTNDELDKFVYRTSHDLRAPLASVLGLINLCKIEEDIVRIKHYVQLKEENIRKLDSILREIIEFSKNSRMGIRMDEVNFSNIIDNAIKANDYTIKGLKVQVDSSIKIDKRFVSDSFRVEIIINHLLSNAINYSKREGNGSWVKIDIDINDKNAVIRIEDNGTGIEKDQQGKIFNMFYRGTSDSMGSGLGLFIVKEAVYKLEGEIVVESVFEEGSVFTVTLPNSINSNAIV